ncbi:penicillin-binding protein [Pseudonocardia sp. K10HN5]|uniref:Penicillin-binding protein n=2 Tax=Pseudonocardia acidicola TaxID=2724939 RepID=A0ABX1SFK1_9PSEU|nr:transglycosylase domain-containing protein [Pseudonocardia acidicola]NMH99677.1 penicillin-binding protein [Pseudonocardia acidicola]
MIGLCLVGGLVLAGFLAPVTVGLGWLSNKVSGSTDPVSAQLVGKRVSTGLPLVTTVLDRNGALMAVLSDQYRLPVSYEQIAPTMTAAIVSVEDRRFFEDSGVDVRAALRAVLHNSVGGSLQGASTITQQYVKNFLINVVDRNDPMAQQADRADTLARKLREAEIAVQINHIMPKTDILAGYLNVVEFSGNIYGIGAAARAFFETTPDRLTVPQAALLAGMVNNPTRYNPYTHPQQAMGRRNTVIDSMVQNQSLSAADAAVAKAAPLGVVPGGPTIPGTGCMSAAPDAGFFCDYAVRYLEQAGFTADQVDAGGYTIQTTMDPTISGTIKNAVDKNVAPTQDGVANTFALIQPGTVSHQVLAMVANRSFGTDADRGQTARNIVADASNVFGAGSSFKIFTTAAALETGKVGFNSTLPDPSSECFPPLKVDRDTRCYPVQNVQDGPPYPDPISLQAALATSPNVAFVDLEAKVGMPAVLQMAERLGLRRTLATSDAGGTPISDPADPLSKNPQYNQPQSQYFQNLLSFTLGNSPVSPLEMANVAATLKSGGTWCPPDPILSVTDRNGRPVQIARPPCQQVVAPALANTLLAGLSQDTVSGTSATAARAVGWTRPDIGKTGTTEESKSVAFIGAANNYAASSMLFADGSNPQELCPGPPVHLGNCGNGAFGGTVAAPPYFQAMSQILAGQPDQPIPGPDPAYAEAGARAPIVPYVVGQDSAAAQQTVQQAGYPVALQQIDSTTAAGRVVGQTPQGNADPHTPITVFVSSGTTPTG